MRKEITVVAGSRTGRGKNEARRLRVAGKIPAVVYGAFKDPAAVTVSPKEINAILRSGTGHNTIFNLDIEGEGPTPVMVVDTQHDPIKGFLLHADLKRIDLTKRIRVAVPVHTAGEAKGIKLQGGLLEVITREVEIECLPDDIPEQYVVDVSELMVGQSVRASAVALAANARLLSSPDSVIAHVVALRVEAAPAPVEGAEPEAAAAAAAEPEVIKKGKKEEEAVPEEKEKKKK